MQLVGPFSGLEAIVEENVPLAPPHVVSHRRAAKWLVRPRTPEELKLAAERCVENGISMHVLGLGANLLVSDEGVNGAVFRLDHDQFKSIQANGTTLEVGAGVDMQKLVLKTVRSGLTGLECLAGIPGTIGGGIRMNAGGKFGDIGAVVTRVTVMSADGTIFDRTKDDLVFDYRSTNISAPFILGASSSSMKKPPNASFARRRKSGCTSGTPSR